MQTINTRSLKRPQHIFDLPAITVWTLAGTGSAIVRLAHALDTMLNRRQTGSRDSVERPRARLGPRERAHADFGVTDAWRIR